MFLDKMPRFKDPFSTVPLPKTFYHPTPAKDVENNVAIQGPDRKQQVPDSENLFKAGSTLHLAALPQLKYVNQREWLSIKPNQIPEDEHDKSYPPLDSTVLSTSHLTSSIDDNQVLESPNNLKNKSGHSQAQDDSVSVLQRYIDRFRYSAPKSRRERERETSDHNGAFWWMKSDASKIDRIPARRKKATNQHYNVHETSSGNEKSGKLTREAVLELDEETSNLQHKADTLLSKSQLSLASSGPCVSTDGLGSSSALSDCSQRSDRQPAYRPVFINTLGVESEPYLPNKKYSHSVQENAASSPDDVLARWRMRKKIGDSQMTATHTQAKQGKQERNKTEIEVKLDEFRKKLFAQRALITSEEIQFERKKMKMIIDDESDDSKDVKSPPVRQISDVLLKSNQDSDTLIEDPVLARIRQTKQASAYSLHKDSFSADEITSRLDSIQCNDSLKGFNSNNANLKSKDDDCLGQPSEDIESLNRNNTAIPDRDPIFPGNFDEFYIDEMKMITVCDPQIKDFVLNSNSPDVPHENIPNSQVSNYSDCIDDSSKSVCYQNDTSVVLNDKEGSLVGEKSEDGKNPSKMLYHQRLQAEKPSDEDFSSVDGEKEKQRNSKTGTSSESIHFAENRPSQKSECDHEGFSSDSSIQKQKLKSKHKVKVKEKKKDKKESDIDDTSSERIDSPDPCSKPPGIIVDASHKLENDGALREKSHDAKSHSREKTPPASKEHVRAISSKSSHQTQIKEAIGEAVVDHLFDRPSMMSSVDSWASLFPQSPIQSQSMHNSTLLLTPTKNESSHRSQTASTPLSHHSAVTDLPIGEECPASPDEFPDDPLMCLLLQQKNEYLKKLEIIESKLQQL